MIPLATATKRNKPRAKSVTFREIVPMKSQADDLAAIYLEVVRHWRNVSERVLAAYDPPALTVDSPPEIETALTAGQAQANALILALTPRVRRWTDLLASWHARKWAANVQAATGVSIAAFLAVAPIADDLATSLAWNVSLIKNVSDQTRDRIANIVWAGWRARTPRNEIARQMNEAVGLGRARSRRIAIDQATKLSGDLDRSRMLEAGIDSWIWRHSGKSHPRPEHVARNGNRYTWQSAPDDIPGELPYCFPSGQPVAIHDDVVMLWRRWHDGEATTFVTDAGETIRCTPNHPVLTDAGWKAAKEVQVGENVLNPRASGIQRFDLDVEKTQPRIGDLFAAGEAVFGSVAIDMTGPEFHGDATVNEKIEVVDSQNGLRDRIVSRCDQDQLEFFLKNTLGSFHSLVCERAPDFGFDANDTSGDSFVSSLNLIEAVCWRQISPDDATGLALVSEVHALLKESGQERWPRYAHALRNSVGGLPALIGDDRFRAIEVLSIVGRALDALGSKAAPHFKVIGKASLAKSDADRDVAQELPAFKAVYNRVENVVTGAWKGHVFNLETVSGWYSAGNIAAKNCGCKAQAVLDL